MAGIRRDPKRATNKIIGLRIYADDREIKGLPYWEELTMIFSKLANKWDQNDIDEILDAHPLGNKIIEALP